MLVIDVLNDDENTFLVALLVDCACRRIQSPQSDNTRDTVPSCLIHKVAYTQVDLFCYLV
jgi:hypothetical protein